MAAYLLLFVIPGRVEDANPEISINYLWIPGSPLRDAPE